MEEDLTGLKLDIRQYGGGVSGSFVFWGAGMRARQVHSPNLSVWRICMVQVTNFLIIMTWASITFIIIGKLWFSKRLHAVLLRDIDLEPQAHTNRPGSCIERASIDNRISGVPVTEILHLIK